MALSIALLALVAAGCDWPQFRGGPDHTGYNPGEDTIGVGNVGTLVQKWTGATNSGVFAPPSIANGVAYVDAAGTTTSSVNGQLYTFDAAGATNCSGTPKVCSPLWTFTLPKDVGLTDDLLYSSPAVVNGVVYIDSFCEVDCFQTTSDLYAFDATGTTNCSGIPKTCQPLWTAALTAYTEGTSPVVVNGVVYVTDGALEAFDANGVINCSGIPKTCNPLWTAPTGASANAPAVSNGVVYVQTTAQSIYPDVGKLYAFDANGNTNCSGTPKTCNPLWSAVTGYPSNTSPAVANGVVYVGSECYYCGVSPGIDGLYAFDAAGTTNCSGIPKTCNPLWTAPTGSAVESSPAVANGVVYVGADDGHLYAFDANGVTNCSGTPKACKALWTAALGSAVQWSPAVANGVVYDSASGTLYAFDALGVTNCSGSPKTCSPLLTAPGGGSPVVANGVVYVGSGGGIHAFGLP